MQLYYRIWAYIFSVLKIIKQIQEGFKVGSDKTAV